MQPPHPPIHVGGAGEKRTLPLVAATPTCGTARRMRCGDLPRAVAARDRMRADRSRSDDAAHDRGSGARVGRRREDVDAARASAIRRFGGPGWGFAPDGYCGTPDDVVAARDRRRLGVDGVVFFLHDRGRRKPCACSPRRSYLDSRADSPWFATVASIFASPRVKIALRRGCDARAGAPGELARAWSDCVRCLPRTPRRFSSSATATVMTRFASAQPAHAQGTATQMAASASMSSCPASPRRRRRTGVRNGLLSRRLRARTGARTCRGDVPGPSGGQRAGRLRGRCVPRRCRLRRRQRLHDRSLHCRRVHERLSLRVIRRGSSRRAICGRLRPAPKSPSPARERVQGEGDKTIRLKGCAG